MATNETEQIVETDDDRRMLRQEESEARWLLVVFLFVFIMVAVIAIAAGMLVNNGSLVW